MKRTFGEKTLRMTAIVLTVIGALTMATELLTAAQEAAKPQAAPTATTPTPAPKIEEKSLAVLEIRRDKVRVLQLEDENLQLKKQVLVNKLLESDDWKKLDAPHKDVQAKLQAELVSVLKAAGIKEEDFPLYEYDKDTMIFKKKVAQPAPPK